MIWENDKAILPPEVKEYAQEIYEYSRFDLFTFSKVVLNYRLLVERIHSPVCSFLSDSFVEGFVFPKLVNEKKKLPKLAPTDSLHRRKKLILLPRGSYKSTICSIAFPLFILKEQPNASILLFSEVKENAIKWLRTIKSHCENNPIFRALYGDWISNKWAETEIIIKPRTVAQPAPSIMVSGANSTTTSQHQFCQIIDDPHSWENTVTQEMIDKIIQTWIELGKQLQPGGFQFVIGTPYTMTDLFSHIQNYYADTYDIMKQSVYNQDDSLWFPEVLNEEFLAMQKGVTQQSVEMYNAHYLLDPSPVGDRKIDSSKFIMFDLKDINLNELNLFIVIDPANSKKRGSSRTAIILMGCDWQNHHYLIDYKVDRMTPDEGVEESVKFVERWKKDYPDNLKGVHPEAVAGYEFFANHLLERIREKNMVVRFDPLKAKGRSKEARILKVDGLTLAVNEGRFHCRRGLTEFIEEADFFPKGSSWDILDAVSYYILDVAYPPPKIIKKEKTEMDYLMEKVDAMDDNLINKRYKKSWHNVLGTSFTRR